LDKSAILVDNDSLDGLLNLVDTETLLSEMLQLVFIDVLEGEQVLDLG
jgi:hypothetical protein